MANWFEIYREVAKLLHQYYNANKSNSGKELYKSCFSNETFVQKNKWIQKFESVYSTPSLDPIHIFSSFNNSLQDTENRILRLNNILGILGSKLNFSQVNFEGCPSPFIIHLLSARKDKEQEEIWSAFNDIYINRQSGFSDLIYKQLKKWRGIDISSFTIFLFWIDSKNFLPLDKNTLGFLLANKKIENKPKNIIQYKNLLHYKNTSLYREIVLISYKIMVIGVKEIIFSNTLKEYLGETSSLIHIESDFKLIALRPLHGIDPKYLKVLKEDQYYKFFQAYNFISENKITYQSDEQINLYNIKNLKINISAVVGMNGSGKSSLSELLYIALNNFSFYLLNTKDLTFVENVFLELYFSSDTLYKIVLQNKKIEVYRYEYKDGAYHTPIKIRKNFINARFFYTIAVNYSHYSLNSKYLPWIKNLFHKNDAYQVPLVINPMRTIGIIDVNKEDYLVKSRLLANFFIPILPDSAALNLRYINDNKKAETLILSLQKDKFQYLYDKIKFSVLHEQENILLDKIYKAFSISNPNHKLLTLINRYILRKLVRISINYPHYNGYFDLNSKKFKIRKFDEYLMKIRRDKSHITNKLYQTINFLKYKHIDFGKRHTFSIEEISDSIELLKINEKDKTLKNIELIPPPIFNIKIKLSDGSDFDDLSSGEKQRIYTVSSLLYHISNIDSVSNNGRQLTNYRCVNVLFDEVELYYHPEMQRTFINYLLSALETLSTNLQAINFCFITHSPLILSDIPKNNILFLSPLGLPEANIELTDTFGANIHELLADSFFLEKGFLGEFARKKIQQLIDKLQPESSIVQSPELMREMEQMIDIIGEPFLQDKLREMYYLKFPAEEIKHAKKKRIQYLENELNNLKNDSTTIQ